MVLQFEFKNPILETKLLFEAAKLENLVSIRLINLAQKILLALFFLSALFFVLKKENYSLGTTLVISSLLLLVTAWHKFLLFFKAKTRKVLPQETTILSHPLEYIDFETAKLFIKTLDFFPETLLITIFNEKFGKFLATRLGISLKNLLPRLKSHLGVNSDIINKNSAESIVQTAFTLAQKTGKKYLDISDIFLTAALLSQEFKNFLNEEKIEITDIANISNWYFVNKEHFEKTGWAKTIQNGPAIGTTWAYAFTPLLNKFSEPVKTGASEEEYLHYIGHKNEIILLEEALLKSHEANALLVGEPGVGKITIVKGLARRIERGQVPGVIAYKKVMKLNLELVFGQKTFGDTAGLLSSVLREAEWAGNIILVIDDIHNYLSAKSQTNVSEILVPFLKSTSIKIIGITDPYGFENSALENNVIINLFEKIDVKEPNQTNVYNILEDIASHKEKKYGIFVTYGAIKKIYDLSEQYLTTSPFPEKAINFLEDAFVYVKSQKDTKVVLPEHIETILERKIRLPVGDIEKEEKNKLLNLEMEMHKRVVDQEEGIKVLAEALRRSRTGLTATNKPIGTFLFLGPTGVGKTETAKALAEFYFGHEEKMIRFDMTEYQKKEDIYRLIGNPDTREPGALATQVRANPFSLLLLDEIEKANSDILNLFLRVFDEGKLTDAFGKRVDFRNTIIIGTSNAGAEFIRQSLIEKVSYEKLQKMLADKLLRDQIFKPEFINRFDAVVVFKPLEFEETKKIAELMLRKLGERIEKQGFKFEISEETVMRLAENVKNSVFGARELRRTIQDTIESPLAKELLEGKYKKGEIIKI